MEEKVILAAWEEVKLHSLRFTMSDVTRRLRMSKSSLYKLASSKDELIHEMLDHVMEQFNREQRRIEDSKLPLMMRIEHFIQSYLSFVQHMFSTGFYSDLKLSYPEEALRWDNFYEAKVNDVMNLLQEGVVKGSFRPISLPVVQHCLYVSAAALTDSEFLRKNNLTYEQAITTLQDLLFHGLLTKQKE